MTPTNEAETSLKHFPSVPGELMRSQVHPADYNPRTITPESRRLLKRSIKKYGVVGGIVVNARTGYTIVGGHQKVAVLDEINGYDPKTRKGDYALRVEVVDLDLKTEKALNVTLNNPNVGGQWDMDALARVIPDIDYRDAGLTEEDLHIIGVDYLLETKKQNDIAGALADLHQTNLEETRREREAQKAAQAAQEGAEDWDGEDDSAADAPRQRYEPGSNPRGQGVDDFFDDGGADAQPSPEERKAKGRAMDTTYFDSEVEKAKKAEAYLVLSFDTYEAKQDFCRRFRLNPDQKFFKGEVFDRNCEYAPEEMYGDEVQEEGE